MEKKYIIAIDEGTSSTRAVLFDLEKNDIVAIEHQKFKQYFPHPGWVEHDAEEIWQKTKTCVDKLILKVKKPNLIAGIGITNQRETIVVWNKKTGQPVGNAIVWQDKRTSEFCKTKLVGRTATTITKKTGLVPDSYFSATKLSWILKNDKKAKKLAKENNLCAGTIESFLTFKLTNGQSFVSDVTNASRTMLFNIHTLKWDDWLLNLFEIPKQILPKVVGNDQIVGEYDFCGSKILVAGLVGDQQSSLFGQACFHKGDIKNTFGTGSFMLMNLGTEPLISKNKLITTIAWNINSKTNYALEGSVFSCGTSIDWLKSLGVIDSSSQCDRMAEMVCDSNGVCFVPAFNGLGAPHWDSGARAMISGITTYTNFGHICCAVLESIAFSVKEIFDVFCDDMPASKKALKVDGGVSKSDFAMQLQSNILGIKVQCAKQYESTSMGAIFMCGLATGIWKNTKQLESIYASSKIFEPKNKTAMLKKYKKWQSEVHKALSKNGGN